MDLGLVPMVDDRPPRGVSSPKEVVEDSATLPFVEAVFLAEVAALLLLNVPEDWTMSCVLLVSAGLVVEEPVVMAGVRLVIDEGGRTTPGLSLGLVATE